MPSTNTRQSVDRPASAPAQSAAAKRCRRKFLHYFPKGFGDETYLAWERDYKWNAHRRWVESLGRDEFARLLRARDYAEIASRAVRIESRTNLIFSFEKMALRDALRGDGARHFAKALFNLLHGAGPAQTAFSAWTDMLAGLPHEGSRVFTWPVATVFGFLAQPSKHIFIKPTVMKRAAEAYGRPFDYQSRPGWPTYRSALQLAAHVRADLRELGPRDMIDVQSFLWVLGSDEYPD